MNLKNENDTGADGQTHSSTMQDSYDGTNRALAPADPSAVYQPFPVEALPDPAGAYVADAAEAVGCDPAYIALPLLVAIAGVIGNSRQMN